MVKSLIYRDIITGNKVLEIGIVVNENQVDQKPNIISIVSFDKMYNWFE